MQTQLNSSASNSNKQSTIIFLLVSYALAFFLYYIDEGNYHFHGLANPLEWIFLSVYALVFLGFMSLAFQIFKKSNLSYVGKLLGSILLGLGALPLLVILISFVIRIFR